VQKSPCSRGLEKNGALQQVVSPPDVEHPMLIHVDGDAFFASVYQATHAHARGKPVVIGYERGIATALSYEAKKYGIKRGMMVSEIKKLCPHVLVVSSDYRAYQLFSNIMVSLSEQFSPYVERYSVDEVFVDVTGLDKVHHMTYEEIGKTLKGNIETSLGITVSVGIAQTKTLAKIASNAHKPSGFLQLDRTNTTQYLQQTPIGDVWGIGYRLTKKMHMYGMQTAYDFINHPESIIRQRFNKMVVQTWHELQGRPMYSISPGKKYEYKSIQKTATVTPPTTDPELLLARIFHHIEKAFIKARKYNYRVKQIDIFLKTQKFTYHSAHIKLPAAVAYPYLIRTQIRQAFKKIYRPYTAYRTTGCTLYEFESTENMQQLLFNNEVLERKLEKLYLLYEDRKVRFGTDLFETHKHRATTLFKKASFT
jgi:DNA polymerase-4/DNA polymerase V